MDTAMSQDGGDMQLRAAQACLSCRKQKRKCDKNLPTCGLCLRMGRACDFSDSTPAPSAEDFALLRQKVTELESRLDEKASSNSSSDWNGLTTPESLSPDALNSNGARSNFPAMFFLDSEVYYESGQSIPRPMVSVTPDVAAVLGNISDIHAAADIYFSTVHLWLPIISRKRLEMTLSNPHLDPSADLALLLLTMKLVTQSATAGPFSAQTSLYWTAKGFFSLVESSALMSLQVLQSNLLIAAYETGHGIYPAAYLTTGHCARLGYALGLHRRKTAPQMIKRPGAWAVVEELGRAWWAVMLLDRYVSLGGNDRPLATEDPLRTHVLPADDSMWDQGEMTTSEALYVSTPTSVKAGAFARTAQATHLLGRLIRLLNERQDESFMRFTEAAQIHRTIAALTNLLPTEVETAPERYGTSIALCYAALLHLCDSFGCTESNRGEHTVEETEMQAIAIAGLKSWSADALRLSQLLQQVMITNLAAASPLTVDCLYQAAAQYAWLVHETGEPEMVAAYQHLIDVLVMMNRRWAVAGEYLKVLDTSQRTLYAGNPFLATNARH